MLRFRIFYPLGLESDKCYCISSIIWRCWCTPWSNPWIPIRSVHEGFRLASRLGVRATSGENGIGTEGQWRHGCKQQQQHCQERLRVHRDLYQQQQRWRNKQMQGGISTRATASATATATVVVDMCLVNSRSDLATNDNGTKNTSLPWWKMTGKNRYIDEISCGGA